MSAEDKPVTAEDNPINQWPKEKLLSLPHREWDHDSLYDSVMILSTNQEHDSGWAMMAVIGVRENQPVEIASGHADDLEWKMPPSLSIGEGYSMGPIRSDCGLASGAIHFWSREYKFKVGAALSSTTIEMIPKTELAKALISGKPF